MKNTIKLLFVIYTPMFFVFLFAAYLTVRWNIRAVHLFADLVQIVNAPFYFGALSQLGCILWAVTAGICLFSGALIRKKGDKKTAFFLFCSGCLTTVLLFDDMFLFHERIAPNIFGIHQLTVLSIYAAAAILYLVFWRSEILKTQYVILIVALGFFTVSVGIDILENVYNLRLSYRYWIEDGSKLFGIAGWCGYFVITSHDYVRSLLSGNLAPKQGIVH